MALFSIGILTLDTVQLLVSVVHLWDSVAVTLYLPEPRAIAGEGWTTL